MTDLHRLSASTQVAKPDVDPALRKAAQGFEAIFLREVIGMMRKSHLADDLFGSSGSDEFRNLADARTADELSKTGSFGLAAMLERQFSRERTKP